MTEQQAPTKARGARGWERLVAQLNAATDLSAFHREMLDLQCKIVAAEYGTLWARDAQGPRPIEAWPKTLAQMPPDSPMMALLAQAARSGFEREASHILKAEPENALEAPDVGAHIFVTVMRAKGQVIAVSTVVAECRDAQVLQTTQPLRELAAGLYEGFFARQEAQEKEQAAQRVRQAMAMLAVAQEASGFGGACLNLVNELAHQLHCTRASLGWVRGRGIRLVAMSDTEHLKRHSEQVGALEMAMSECIDQQQPIVFPVPENAEPLLQQAVIHAHRKVTGNQPHKYVLSLPLRHRDEWIGALTLERSNEPFDPPLVQYLQLVADVAAPQLADRKESDRWLIVHAWRSLERSLGWFVGPRHVMWKVASLVAAAALAFVIFGSWDYKVTAPFVFEAEARRLMPCPFEAPLKAVHVKPGDPVEAGAVLAELDVTQRRLDLALARARLAVAQAERDKHMGTAGAAADMQMAEATMAQIQAEIDLLEWEIGQATLHAPVKGVVLAGQWHDKVGGMIRQGDQLFEIAPIEQLTALIRVADTDIEFIDMAGRQRGRLATRSEPGHKFEFTIERVVPLAMPHEGVNSFEARARLDTPAPWMRPGMEGVARVEAGRQPVWWILTHRMVEIVRLWVWW